MTDNPGRGIPEQVWDRIAPVITSKNPDFLSCKFSITVLNYGRFTPTCPPQAGVNYFLDLSTIKP